MKRLIVVAGTVALFATGCSAGFNRPVREITAVVGDDHMQRVRVTTHSFWFEPNRIVVKRGIPVELTVKNGAFFVPHDFSCGAVGSHNLSPRVSQIHSPPAHCGVTG